jgi:UDP-N-acetyl-D-mannosaminuronic acid transferase (WecB/TagA/CpsF family)
MQKYALEWLWRLGLEPKRLWRRYVLLNPAYLSRLAAQKSGLWKAKPPEAASEPVASFAV